MKQKENDWKSRLGMVYSTNSDFQYETEQNQDIDTLPAKQQKLRVNIEKRNRGGKVVTLIKGFLGKDDDLKTLGKTLKTKCGVGGAVKDNEIIIQGDFKQKIIEILIREGYSQTK